MVVELWLGQIGFLLIWLSSSLYFAITSAQVRKKKKNRNSRALESELGRNCLINLKGHVLLGESYQVLHLFPINYVKLTVAIWLLNIFENTSPLARILLLICTSQMEQIILYNAAKYCSHCLPPLSPLAYLIVVFLQVTYMGNIKTS
jgi:hypothetical protein